MERIIRVPIRDRGKQMFTVPEGSIFLHVQINPPPNFMASIYLLADPDARAVHIYIYVIRETEELPVEADPAGHLGSFEDGCYVWHLFKDRKWPL